MREDDRKKTTNILFCGIEATKLGLENFDIKSGMKT